MKFLVTFCLFVSLATVAWTSSASWGRRNNYDYLLYRENVLRRPQNGNYWTVTVSYPKSGYSKNVTAIFVYDRITNSSGTFPSLVSGGPGYNYAQVKLRGQFSRGINSTVEFYGD